MLKRLIGAVTGRDNPKSKSSSGKQAQSTKTVAKQGKGAVRNKKQGRHKVDHDQNILVKQVKGAAKSNAESGKSNRSRKSQRRSKKTEAPWDPAQFKVEQVPGKTRFHDLQLPDSVMQGIHKLGFSYCTPIQAESLPAALRGRDTIGQAQTGTGKSAAFLLTILNRLLTVVPEQRYASEPRALVIAPTRELVMQIGKDAEALARYTGLNIATIVGGMNYDEQRRKLRDEVVDVLVATPGRLIDFMGSQDVFLDQVDILVLDEADRMLDMGFIPDVRRIVRATPPKGHRQTLLYSATFNYDVRLLIDQWCYEPRKVVIEPEQVATDRVDQRLYLVSESDKYGILERVLRDETPERCIVFANRRDLTRNLCDKLNKHGHKAVLLSGEVNQQKRIKTLERFRDGQVSIMVATDVAGRGIHVDGVSHVVNYTLPEDPEDYVHRIGRTGRAGAKGVSVSLISEDDAFVLPELEAYLGKKLELSQP